jgi:hypothetical protein
LQVLRVGNEEDEGKKGRRQEAEGKNLFDLCYKGDTPLSTYEQKSKNIF